MDNHEHLYIPEIHWLVSMDLHQVLYGLQPARGSKTVKSVLGQGGTEEVT